MRLGTIIFFLLSAALFFIVRHFLIKWGLVEPRKHETMYRGDFGMQTLFAYAAYFVLWVCPSWIGWSLLCILRDFGWTHL